MYNYKYILCAHERLTFNSNHMHASISLPRHYGPCEYYFSGKYLCLQPLEVAVTAVTTSVLQNAKNSKYTKTLQSTLYLQNSVSIRCFLFKCIVARLGRIFMRKIDKLCQLIRVDENKTWCIFSRKCYSVFNLLPLGKSVMIMWGILFLKHKSLVMGVNKI